MKEELQTDKHKEADVTESQNEDERLIMSLSLISQDAFVELYGESRPPVSSWSLRTVFGLAVLGAAGITLGLLFTQR